MSLATRCTACGTIFRIVEDQLRVSDGWVRCGRCAEVFDARELLFDIERDTPPAWPPAYAPPAPAYAEPPAPAQPTWEGEPETEREPPPIAPARDDQADSRPAQGIEFREPVFDPQPGGSSSVDDAQRHEPRWMEDDEANMAGTEAGGPTPAPQAAPDELRSPAATAPATGSAVPEFVRRAEAVERWRSPRVRLALGLASLVLLAGLGLQVALQFRDALVALFPAARPAMVALCQGAGCEVRPWRRADVLKIDSSALTQIGSRNGYRLSLSLRNESAVEVAMPWLELTVSDASGTVLARRVLPPSALNPSLELLPAEGEQALQLSFSTGAHRVSGYTVDVFQP